LSSILKALKKLEEESLHQKMIYPGSSGRSKDIMVSRSRFTLTWPYKVFITVCLLTAFLVMARWLMLSKSPVLVQHVYEKQVSPPQEKPIIAAVPMKHANASPSDTVAENLFTKKDLPQAIPNRYPQMNNEDSDSPAISRQSPSMSFSTQSTVPEDKEALPASFSSVEERRDDSRLKLQAIAWSLNPEKRIAVINNQIVREGSSIQGISVIHILEDQVIFREGEATFKMTFGLK
jgi:hypothetical protein